MDAGVQIDDPFVGGRSHIEQLLDGGFIEMNGQAGSDKMMQNILFQTILFEMKLSVFVKPN